MEINQIYNRECLEAMQEIESQSIDMILCDLPYGTTNCKWDVIIPFDKLWEQYKRIIKDNGAIVLTAAQPFTSLLVCSNLEMFKYEWIWEKHQGTGFLNAKKQVLRIHENIVVFYKNQCTYNPQKTTGHRFVGKDKQRRPASIGVYRKLDIKTSYKDDGTRYPVSVQKFDYDSDRYNSSIFKNRHPTQKPVALFEYLIKTYTNENDLVLDNCIGSGTTAIAALNTNRNYLGFELDKGYFDIAEKRIFETKQQLRLF